MTSYVYSYSAVPSTVPFIIIFPERHLLVVLMSCTGLQPGMRGRNSSVFRFLIIKINCGKEILKVKGEQSLPIKLIADRVLKSGCTNSNTDLFRVRNLLVGQLLALFLTKLTRVCDFKVVFGTRCRLGVICLIKNTFVWPKYNVAFECKQKHLNHV